MFALMVVKSGVGSNGLGYLTANVSNEPSAVAMPANRSEFIEGMTHWTWRSKEDDYQCNTTDKHCEICDANANHCTRCKAGYTRYEMTKFLVQYTWSEFWAFVPGKQLCVETERPIPKHPNGTEKFSLSKWAEDVLPRSFERQQINCARVGLKRNDNGTYELECRQCWKNWKFDENNICVLDCKSLNCGNKTCSLPGNFQMWARGMKGASSNGNGWTEYESYRDAHCDED